MRGALVRSRSFCLPEGRSVGPARAVTGKRRVHSCSPVPRQPSRIEERGSAVEKPAVGIAARLDAEALVVASEGLSFGAAAGQ